MKWSARGWDEGNGAAHSLGQNWNVAARSLVDDTKATALSLLSFDDHEVRWSDGAR